MGATHLNQPVFSMAPTKSGKGYWLVARDGGIFTFGDGHFYGSTGAITLNQPIDGITTSPTGKGYRMVARRRRHLQLRGRAVLRQPSRHRGQRHRRRRHRVDPRRTRATGSPSRRSRPRVRRRALLRQLHTVLCDAVTGIFSNPKAQGYRLVLRSGATIPFGTAPGGKCEPPERPRLVSLGRCRCLRRLGPLTRTSGHAGDFVKRRGRVEGTFLPGPGHSASISSEVAPVRRDSVHQCDPIRRWGLRYMIGAVTSFPRTERRCTLERTQTPHAFTDRTNAGLDINRRDGGGCNNSYGTFTINYLTYETKEYPGHVAKFDVTFVQHCESPSAPPLYEATFVSTTPIDRVSEPPATSSRRLRPACKTRCRRELIKSARVAAE